MNKNKKIFDFEYNDEEHIIVKFDRNYPDNEIYAPFGLIRNDNIDKNQFNKWWKNRQIPASRNGLKELLHKSNIYDEDILWEDINFFDNEFSEDIGKLDGFVNEAKEILSSNKLLSNERIEKITEQIKLRIEFVSQLKQIIESNSDC